MQALGARLQWLLAKQASVIRREFIEALVWICTDGKLLCRVIEIAPHLATGAWQEFAALCMQLSGDLGCDLRIAIGISCLMDDRHRRFAQALLFDCHLRCKCTKSLRPKTNLLCLLFGVSFLETGFHFGAPRKLFVAQGRQAFDHLRLGLGRQRSNLFPNLRLTEERRKSTDVDLCPEKFVRNLGFQTLTYRCERCEHF